MFTQRGPRFSSSKLPETPAPGVYDLTLPSKRPVSRAPFGSTVARPALWKDDDCNTGPGEYELTSDPLGRSAPIRIGSAPRFRPVPVEPTPSPQDYAPAPPPLGPTPTLRLARPQSPPREEGAAHAFTYVPSAPPVAAPTLALQRPRAVRSATEDVPGPGSYDLLGKPATVKRTPFSPMMSAHVPARASTRLAQPVGETADVDFANVPTFVEEMFNNVARSPPTLRRPRTPPRPVTSPGNDVVLSETFEHSIRPIDEVHLAVRRAPRVHPRPASPPLPGPGAYDPCAPAPRRPHSFRAHTYAPPPPLPDTTPVVFHTPGAVQQRPTTTTTPGQTVLRLEPTAGGAVVARARSPQGSACFKSPARDRVVVVPRPAPTVQLDTVTGGVAPLPSSQVNRATRGGTKMVQRAWARRSSPRVAQDDSTDTPGVGTYSPRLPVSPPRISISLGRAELHAGTERPPPGAYDLTSTFVRKSTNRNAKDVLIEY